MRSPCGHARDHGLTNLCIQLRDVFCIAPLGRSGLRAVTLARHGGRGHQSV